MIDYTLLSFLYMVTIALFSITSAASDYMALIVTLRLDIIVTGHVSDSLLLAFQRQSVSQLANRRRRRR